MGSTGHLPEELPDGKKLVRLRPENPRYKVILSLTGGGVRGIIPAIVLQAFEEIVKEVAHEETGEPKENLVVNLSSCFDLIAGTSAGSILGLYLASGGGRQELYQPGGCLEGIRPGSAEGAITFVSNMAKEIFPTSFLRRIPGVYEVTGAFRTLYRRKALERSMDAIFGEMTMKDCKLNTYIPVFELNKDTRAAFSMHHHRWSGRKTTGYIRLSPQPNDNSSSKQFCWKEANFPLKVAALASSSAPVFFPPAEFEQDGLGKVIGINGDKVLCVDGGLHAVDPSLQAMEFIADTLVSENYSVPWEKMAVLSLGTGCIRKPLLRRYSGLLSWKSDLPSILLGSQTYSDREVAGPLLNFKGSYERYVLIDKIVEPESEYFHAFETLDAADKLPKL